MLLNKFKHIFMITKEEKKLVQKTIKNQKYIIVDIVLASIIYMLWIVVGCLIWKPLFVVAILKWLGIKRKLNKINSIKPLYRKYKIYGDIEFC